MFTFQLCGILKMIPKIKKEFSKKYMKIKDFDM